MILNDLPVRITSNWFWHYDDDGNQLDTGRYMMVASVRCRCPFEYGLAQEPERFDEERAIRILALAVLDEREVDGQCRCGSTEAR
jgi:hypothetical protein